MLAKTITLILFAIAGAPVIGGFIAFVIMKHVEHKKVQMELAIKRKKLMKEFDRLTRPKSVKESYDEFVLMNLEYVCRSRPISSDPKHWN